MRTHSLDVVLSKPGIYLIMSPVGILFCEVDTDGKCYQLEPDHFSRDGVLDPDGWIDVAAKRLLFVGPLARPATQEVPHG